MMMMKMKVCFFNEYNFFKSNNFVSFFSAKQTIQQDMMTDKDLDEFLIDLVKKHGLKTIQRTLKSKK